MKRFYKLVSIAPQGEGFAVLLDGKPVKTPSRQALLIPSERLAQAVMQEWNSQQEDIIPDSMPVTQILVTAQDRVAKERDAMHAPVMAYLDTDLLCYRASLPHEIAARQKELWDPWLQWFESEFGIALETTEGLAALKQPDQARKASEDFVAALDIPGFTVLQLVTALSGSLVLALAFLKGKAGPEEVMQAMFAEEDYKAGVYNEGFHGFEPQAERKRNAAKRDLEACAVVLGSLA